MTLSWCARVGLLGCAMCFTLPAGASLAHPTTFTADPPVAFADRAVAVADEWLADTAADCARWRAKTGRDVLAIEQSFLEQIRKPRAAAIDAGSPSDADEAVNAGDNDGASAVEPEANNDEGKSDETKSETVNGDTETNDNIADGNLFVPLIILSDRGPDDIIAANDSDEDLGVWRAIKAKLFGGEYDCQPGCVAQVASLARNIVIGYELPRFDLLADDEAGDTLDLPTDQCKTPIYSPIAPASTETETYNPFSSLQAWPAVTDEATTISIIGPRTTTALNDWMPSGTAWRSGGFEVARRPAEPREADLFPSEQAGESTDASPSQNEDEISTPANADEGISGNFGEETPNTIGGWGLED